MNQQTFEKFGGMAIVVGALLLCIYAIAFTTLSPVTSDHYDFLAAVQNPNWVYVSATSFVGVLLMIIGFAAVYTRMRADAGAIGFFGFVFVEAAYLLQACKVTWELFLYPVIAEHPQSAFLFTDDLLRHAPSIVVFRSIASITIFVGISLFCLALYRSSAYPKAAAILIFVGAFVYGLGPMLSLVLAIGGILTLSVGCLLLGLRLAKPTVSGS